MTAKVKLRTVHSCDFSKAYCAGRTRQGSWHSIKTLSRYIRRYLYEVPLHAIYTYALLA